MGTLSRPSYSPTSKPSWKTCAAASVGVQTLLPSGTIASHSIGQSMTTGRNIASSNASPSMEIGLFTSPRQNHWRPAHRQAGAFTCKAHRHVHVVHQLVVYSSARGLKMIWSVLPEIGPEVVAESVPWSMRPRVRECNMHVAGK